MHNIDKIDRYFRNRLGEFEQIPPDENWDIIARKLENRKKKAAVLLFLRIAAGMALLVSTGIGYYLITKPGQQVEPSNLTLQEEKSISGNNVVPPDKDNLPRPVPKNIKPKGALAAEISGNSIEDEVTAIDPPVDDIKDHASVADIRSLPGTRIENIRIIQLPLPVSSGLQVTKPSNRGLLTQNEALALLLEDYNQEYDSEPAEKVSKHRWMLGSEVAPLYSDRVIQSDDVEPDVIDELNRSESGILAYAGGIHVAFAANKRLTVQSGLYYSRYGQKKNQAEVYSNNYAKRPYLSNDANIISVINSTGIITGTAATEGSVATFSNDIGEADENVPENGLIRNYYSTYNFGESEDIVLKQYFDYFEVPLILKYKFIDRKIDFNFSGGLVTNFMIGNKVDMIIDGRTTNVGETTNINHVNYLGSFGLGLEYPLASGFALTLEPRFRYYINSIDKSSQIMVHPYSFGFFAGINYRF